jgi:hypothetical protein
MPAFTGHTTVHDPLESHGSLPLSGSPPPRQKRWSEKIINPNVAIELGYTLHALGDRALLMVMNEHFGSRADLPFELQSKAGPIIV